MSGSGILLDPCYFAGNVNNGSYFDTSDNFDLPQLQDFFMTQFENFIFQHLWQMQDGAVTSGSKGKVVSGF